MKARNKLDRVQARALRAASTAFRQSPLPSRHATISAAWKCRNATEGPALFDRWNPILQWQLQSLACRRLLQLCCRISGKRRGSMLRMNGRRKARLRSSALPRAGIQPRRLSARRNGAGTFCRNMCAETPARLRRQSGCAHRGIRPHIAVLLTTHFSLRPVKSSCVLHQIIAVPTSLAMPKRCCARSEHFQDHVRCLSAPVLPGIPAAARLLRPCQINSICS